MPNIPTTRSACTALAPETVRERKRRSGINGFAMRAWRATKAEAVLRGAPATEEVFGRAAEAELADAQPLPGNAFKVPLARNVLVRTLLDLTEEEVQP